MPRGRFGVLPGVNGNLEGITLYGNSVPRGEAGKVRGIAFFQDIWGCPLTISNRERIVPKARHSTEFSGSAPGLFFQNAEIGCWFVLGREQAERGFQHRLQSGA